MKIYICFNFQHLYLVLIWFMPCDAPCCRIYNAMNDLKGYFNTMGTILIQWELRIMIEVLIHILCKLTITTVQVIRCNRHRIILYTLDSIFFLPSITLDEQIWLSKNPVNSTTAIKEFMIAPKDPAYARLLVCHSMHLFTPVALFKLSCFYISSWSSLFLCF